MSEKILVIGASGFIGENFYSYLKSKKRTVIGTYYKNKKNDLFFLDLLNFNEVLQFIERYNPSKIFLFSAVSTVEECEKNKEYAQKLNIEVPYFIGKICEHKRICFYFFSTDMIFSGKKGTPYVEEDKPSPLSYYGYTKAKAEEKLVDFECAKIFRISLNIGRKSPFVKWIKERIKQKKIIPLFCDEYRNFTYVMDLSFYLEKLISMNLRGKIYHLSSKNSISRCEFGNLFFSHVKKGKELVKKVYIKDLQLNRPTNLTLCVEKIEKESDFKLIDVKESMKNFLIDFQKYEKSIKEG